MPAQNRSYRRQRRLFLEPLEERRVLDVGLASLIGEESDASSDVALLTALVDESANEIPAATTDVARFASADDLKQYLVQDALARYGDMFGQKTFWAYPVYMELDANVATVAGPSERVDYSGTNNQVAGVEEGDVVETDGEFLYILDNGQLDIVDVRQPDALAVVSTTPMTGSPVAMYLNGEHLTVVSQDWGPVYCDALPTARMGFSEGPRWDGPKFHVTVWDVTDPAQPQVARDLQIDGNYVDTRMIDGFVYVVSQDGFYLPPPEAHPIAATADKTEPPDGTADDSTADDGTADDGTADDSTADDSTADDATAPNGVAGDVAPPDGLRPFWELPSETYVYETQEEYLARIEPQVFDLALPQYTARGADGNVAESGWLSQPEAIYRPLTKRADSLLSITTIDTASATPSVVASTAAPLDWANQVYLTPQSLYLSTPTWQETEPHEATAIYQFALDAATGRVEYVANGSVPGQLLNQFALDEYQGTLRVVTQRGWRADAATDLFTLRPDGQSLKQVGSLTDLAPGEQLFSVRFLGDRGYVVTFGPTGGNWFDPLFAIDLSDPTQPQLGGQLEIPGFSNYLQAVEDGFLIGLGRNADPSNGRPLEPQVSLYDVTDFRNPQLTDRLSFADVGEAWSDAFSTHHAISYFPEQHILAIPMSTYGWAADVPTVLETQAAGLEGEAANESPDNADPTEPGDPDATDPAEPVDPVVIDPVIGLLPPDGDVPWPVYREQNALWVFRIDTAPNAEGQHPLQLLGKVEHQSPVRRSVQVGDGLFSVAYDAVKATTLDDPSQLLGEVPLPKSPDIWPVVPPNDPEDPTDPDDPTDPNQTTGDPPKDDETTGTVDVAERMVGVAKQALARLLSVAEESLALVSVEAVTWPDASLGVPREGNGYVQVLTPGFRIVLRHEAISYEYHTDSGNRAELAQRQAEPLVRIRLQTVDTSGQALAEVETGQEFVLNVYVEDLREPAQGVAAAYLDVLYYADVVRVAGPITFAAEFGTATSGDTAAVGLLDELGAASGGATASGERLLASIPFTAQRPGRAAFVSTPADQDGHDVLVVGASNPVAELQVEYVDTAIKIGDGWCNMRNPGDVNGDGRTSAQDVVTVIDRLNDDRGPHPLGRVADFRQQAPEAVHEFLDVNNDGNLTAVDALLIINHINDLLATGLTPGGADDDWVDSAAQLAGPLAGFVDWDALQNALHSQSVAGILDSLNLTAEQALDLAHKVLADVDVGQLTSLVSAVSTALDPQVIQNLIQQVLPQLQGQVSAARLLQIASDVGSLVDGLELEDLAPRIAADLDLPSARQSLRDNLFAGLLENADWLGLLPV